MLSSNGILFNHESPIRGETFVTRMITRSLGRIIGGLDEKLYIGNLDARRDWGHARDFVEAMWLMLQQEKPDDYVIATGEQHSVREFIELAGRELGMEISWQGSEIDEVGIDNVSGNEIVAVDPRYFRPTEVDTLLGDPSKARSQLGWQARTSFEELVREMVAADYEGVERSVVVRDAGFKTYESYE